MSSEAAAPVAAPNRAVGVVRALRRWESALVVILIATLIFGTAESPNFLTTTTIFFGGLDIGQIAIMALPLTLIVITGEIDLSVAAMLGLSASSGSSSTPRYRRSASRSGSPRARIPSGAARAPRRGRGSPRRPGQRLHST